MARLIDKCYSVSISCCHLRKSTKWYIRQSVSKKHKSRLLCKSYDVYKMPINLKKKHETLCSSIEIQLQRAIGPWLPFYRCLSECSPCLTLEFQEHQNTMFWPQTFLPASSVISTFTICLRDVVNSSLLILSSYWIRFILRRPSQIFSS